MSGVLDREMADASSLVLPEIGLLRSDDPRFHATIDMVSRKLMKNGFIMRYIEADDFGAPSNAFLLCTFWYIDALASVGRREEVDEYRKLRTELDRLAGRINGRFSEFDWTPLRYSTRGAPRSTLAGLYRLGRIGVVTPLRDGMNLVAKEFVAAQSDEDPGVLVLSQFAGAAQDLTEALIVNPFDPDAIADAMHVALSMPLSERQERQSVLREKVMRTTADAYCRRFIEALEAPVIARAA